MVHPFFRLPENRVRLTPEYYGGIIGGVGLGTMCGAWLGRDWYWFPLFPIGSLLIFIGSSIALNAQRAQRALREREKSDGIPVASGHDTAATP